MGRAPCCSKVGLHRGPWTPKEDALLTKYIQAHGEGQWKSLPKKAGLLRCGKSCRLRWMNYLRPDIKRGNITPEEDDLILRMHSLLGNRWSLIAGRLPGRTDNEIKNYWNTHLSKRLRNQENTDSPQETAKKKSSKNGGDKKKKPTKKTKTKTNEKEEPERTKIYLPKPIRVSAFSTPRTDSNFTLDSNSASGSTSQEANKGANNGFWENLNVCENDGFDFLDENNDLVNGSEECQPSDFDMGDYGSLEKLYEEYLQLLNTDVNQAELDSFDECIDISYY